MLNATGGHDTHDKFRELCALAASGNLAPFERVELQVHLQACEECRDLFRQFRLLTTEGLAVLAETYPDTQVSEAWDELSTRQRLLRRVHAQDSLGRGLAESGTRVAEILHQPWIGPLVRLGLAAVLVLTVAGTAYHMGRRTQARSVVVAESQLALPPMRGVATESQTVNEVRAAQERKLSELERDGAQREQELGRLRAALRSVEERTTALTMANQESEKRVQDLGTEKNALNAQLQAATLAYDQNREQLAHLQGERDRTTMHVASLEAKVSELSVTNREQDRRLKDAEQFLSSDRDIRELMGARNLYIADVFDVDGTSRTQKPYGRVFYTRGKSLIFYAFDLDRRPKVTNAGTFQVWGQREAPVGEQAAPLNLGILYMDSEANRRWVMRFDDPRQLAEIDAVFVTVEPRGGSQKPTSKPFLYALLRNEVNHP